MISKRVTLHFLPSVVDEPIISRLTRKYDLNFNILKASIDPEKGGLLVLELGGKKECLEEGLNFLMKLGVRVQPLSSDITYDEERCTHCGLCVGFCPSGALSMDRDTMKVSFDATKCIACEVCIKQCPARAMHVYFERSDEKSF